jgi:hypothetical protein
MMVLSAFVQLLEKLYKLRSSNSGNRRQSSTRSLIIEVMTYKRSKYPLFQVCHCKIIHIIRNTIIVHLISAPTVVLYRRVKYLGLKQIRLSDLPNTSFSR